MLRIFNNPYSIVQLYSYAALLFIAGLIGYHLGDSTQAQYALMVALCVVAILSNYKFWSITMKAAQSTSC